MSRKRAPLPVQVLEVLLAALLGFAIGNLTNSTRASSLVQAGVVPRLRRRRGKWIVVPTVVPGDHPLRSLTRSLAAAASGHTIDIQTSGFVDELRIAHGESSAPVLVIVDQAES